MLKHQLVWLLLAIFLACNVQAQKQVVFTLTDVPEYTPATDTIFITGSFNNWKLADKNYQFQKMPNGVYRLAIRLANPQLLNFKINRGDWDKVEGNDVGGYIENREFNFNESVFEYKMSVRSWQDLHQQFLPSTTLKLVALPKNTPTDAKIFVSGTFNGWSTSDPEYELTKAHDGTYSVEINSGLKEFSYKFSRGSWSSVEARWDGGIRSNRTHTNTGKSATIIVEIEAWEDLTQRLVVWKIVFSFFFVQLLIIAYYLLRNKKSSFVVSIAFLLALGYLFRFVHCDYELASTFPKVRLLSNWLLAFFVAPVYYHLRTRYTKLAYFHWSFLLPALPIVVLLYYWQVDNKDFNLLVIDNHVSKLNFVLYTYAVAVNFYFIYQCRKLFGELKFRISAFNQQLFASFQTLVFFISAILVLAFLACLSSCDSKLINDWFENLTWSGLGVLMIHVQLVGLRETEVLLTASKQQAEPKIELPTKKHDVLKERLNQLMEDKLLYTNPKLSLSELAKLLGTNTYYVSKLINDGLGMSFTDYVNSYRVKAFIREMEESPEDKTFLYVALNVGFNSKSSFNRAFKKVTGKTPSAYFGHMPSEVDKIT